MAQDRIRIRLTAYDHRLLDRAVKEIIDTVRRTGAVVAGPIPLPTKRSWLGVIRSPHKYKYSQEQFEIRQHKRLIDIKNPKPQTTEALMDLKLPAGVNVEIKVD